MGHYLAECLWLDKGSVDVQSLRKALTVRYRPLNAEEDTVVRAYKENRTHIGVPRQYGLKLISKFDDRRSVGAEGYWPSSRPALDIEQQPVVGSLLAADSCDTVLSAATGKGKTVMSLYVAAERGRATLVVVDMEKLKKQWSDRAREHFGLTDDHIGYIQGERCDYQGKTLVIAMIQTLTRRRLPDDVLSYFGTVIFDECHTTPAPTFSQTLLMFPADFRFGVSATVDREDALQRLLHYSLGEVSVSMEAKHAASSVYVVSSDTCYSWAANALKTTGKYLAEIADDGKRNHLIAESVKWLFESGRDTLVLSDRIEQLVHLRSMLIFLGVPVEVIGVYSGYVLEHRYVVDPSPVRKPFGHVSGTAYCPVRLFPSKIRQSSKRLAEVERTSKVLLATYGMFEKGADVPRLAAGLDATPRTRGTQMIGRTLRPLDGKLRPIWVTIRDVNSYRSLYHLRQRLEDFVDSSAEIYEWVKDKGVRRLDQKAYSAYLAKTEEYLRSLKVIQTLDGNYTLTTKDTPTR